MNTPKSKTLDGNLFHQDDLTFRVLGKLYTWFYRADGKPLELVTIAEHDALIESKPC